MRTFSKAFALAGLRVGYAVGGKELIAGFDRVRNHFGMGNVAKAGALAAFQDREWLGHVVGQVANARDRIAAFGSAAARRVTSTFWPRPCQTRWPRRGVKPPRPPMLPQKARRPHAGFAAP